MKKLKEHIKKLDLKVLNHTVEIIVTNDVIESRLNRCEELGLVELSPQVRALFSSTGGGKSYIFLPTNCPNYVRCHEAFHCVDEIMRFIGAKHENEVVAYTLSYFVEEIDDFLKEIRKKSKKDLTKVSKSGKLKKN